MRLKKQRRFVIDKNVKNRRVKSKQKRTETRNERQRYCHLLSKKVLEKTKKERCAQCLLNHDFL
jgi:hypothetical protein